MDAGFFIIEFMTVSIRTDERNYARMTTSISETPCIVADLDGTLLHDGETFEDRFLTERSIHAIELLHERDIPFIIATARPVSTGIDIAHTLHPDAVIYLNGSLIDYDPEHSTPQSLSQNDSPERENVTSIGFPSSRASEICRTIIAQIPSIHIGIVMDDVRYTNFDLSQIWTTQTWQYTDFTDIPEGTVDKIIIFPTQDQVHKLHTLIPEDLAVNISEGIMWMVMNPLANKEHALELICERWGRSPKDLVSFGDDLIDIGMLNMSGTGIAVANAHPSVLQAADQVCPSNNDDGVAQWIEQYLDSRQ